MEELIPMSKHSEIFEARFNLDTRRQPAVKDQLVALNSKLGPEQTPYDRIPAVRRMLMSFGFFSVGASGRQASLPQCNYLYRVTSLSKVRTFTEWKGDREIELQQALGDLVALSKDAIESDGWLPLSTAAEGVLKDDRSFTWWSSHPIGRDTVICDLHLRGMPNDWIVPHSLLLRCSVQHLLSISEPLTYIPNALDGYESSIFRSTNDSDMPTCGTAINIEDPEHLTPGADEFVLKPIPVESIEFHPILLDESLRGHKVEETDLLKSLRAYYVRELSL
jgi:hypothetical protein